MKTPLFDDKVQSIDVTELGIASYNMESGERLSSPSSAPSSLHMASSSAGSSPAPPQMPSAKCGPAFSLASSSPLSAENFPSELLRCTKSQGPLRQMSGDGSLKRPAKSNSFPLVSRPASRLYSSSSGRCEFGGLGSLGLSAFAAHPQFGTFPVSCSPTPDWWWPSEAHLRGAAAFLPPLLGLHPAFASTIKSQDPAHSQPRTSVSVDMNGTVNGRSGSPPIGKSTTNSSLIQAKRNKEKTQATCCPKSSQDPGHQKTALQTKEKNPGKRPLETSSMSGSQSGSLSESSSDVEESSSDADDMEEEDIDEEEDDQSNDSEDSDSTTEGCLKRKAKWLTQSTSDSKKKRLCIADENPTQDSHCDGVALTPLHRLQSSHPDDRPLSASPFLQSCRAAEEENQQHISVIQATGTATSNSPFALSLRDVSPLASSSSPNPKSFSNSPKDLPLTASPKHFSPKHSSVSSSPQPLALHSPMKPLSPKSSPSPKFLPLSSTPKPPALSASQKPAHTQSSLVLSSNHTWPFDSLKESSGSLSEENSFHFNSFKLRQAGHSKDSLKQVFSLQHPSQSCETNLFLGHHANGVTHPEVQDAPLALITKPRVQSCTFNTKPLLAATSPSYPMPINLSTTTKEPSCSTASLPKSTSSSRPAHGSRKTKTPTSLSAGKTVSKTHSSCSPVDLDKGSESDIHSSKDSESDSLGDDFDEDEDDDIEEDDSGTSLSESESNMDSDSDSSEDDLNEHGEMEAGSDVERFPLKVAKAPLSAHKTSSSLSASSSPLNLQVVKPTSSPCGLLTPNGMTRLGALSNLSALSTSFTLAALPGPGKRRTVTDESVLRLPLEFGWRRETRIRTVAGRLQGEVAYFAPCGKKMRQYPDVMKYLLRNGIIEISRDNFSFSTKIKVGEFYGAREGAEGLQWVLLAEEEITPTIIAMDGRRSRRLKSEHQPTGDGTGSQQLKSHPIPENNIQDVTNAKLLRKLEAQEIARQAAHIKLRRKLEKQAMVQAAKEARKQQAILAAEERRKKREQIKILKQQEKIKRIQQIRMEKELRAQQILEAKRRRKEEAANARILEAEKRNKEREMQRLQAVILKHQELERLRLDMERERRRQHMMLMKAVETRKKAEEKERLKKEKDDERRLNKERKLELKRLEVEKAKELKKPNEDMCLADHKLLPELSRVPGLVLPGNTFSDCLMVLQFLHSFGKVLGLDTNLCNLKLNDLQEGLLNIRGGLGKVQDLLVSVLSVAVCDPGIPAGHKNKTCLGELLSNVKINRGNVSEILRIYMEAHCEQTELAALAASLRTKAFQAHTPCQKVSMLVFLVNELCCSKAVISEIDKNIDHMSNLRKDKWVVDGELRKLRSIHTKKTGKRHSNVGGEDNLTFVIPNAKNKGKQKEGDSEEEEDEDDDTEDQGDDEDEEEEDSGGKKGKKAEICEEEDDSVHSTNIDELEKQIEKTYKQQSHIRQQLFESSHSLRSMIIGQDRYKRSYWLLPQCGIFVEGMESSEGCEALEMDKERQETVRVIRVKEEQLEETTMPAVSSLALSAGGDTAAVESQQDKDSRNLFIQNPGSLSKLSKLLEVAKLAQDSNVNTDNSQNCHSVKIPTTASYPSIPSSQTGMSHSPLPANTHQRLGDRMDTVTSPLCAPHFQSSPWITCSPQPVLQPDQDNFLQLSKIVMDKSSQWFTLLPRSPCDDCSVTSGSSPSVSSSSPQTTSTKSLSSLSPNPPATVSHNTAAQINNRHSPVLQQEKSGTDQGRLTLSDVSSAAMSPSLPFSGTSLPPVLDQASQHAESNGNGVNNNTVKKSETPEALSDKCPSASSPAVDVAKTQDYPRPQPIPEEMLRGWWRVSDTQELHSLVKALHSRGIREKVLQKQIQKHMEYVIQLCASSKVIDVSELEKLRGCEKMADSWNVEEQAMDVDTGLLQQVEDLERRVVSAGLQVKGWTHPERHSDREDLVYHEHPLVSSPAPDSKGCRETNPEKRPDAVVRQPNNPLDIAVMRLAELEKNIEPSSDEKKVDPGMRLWHEALSQVRSSAQLSLCIQQLQKSIAWERSIMKVHCQHCQKGDNEELLLLCDGCDKGCHTYCHKPKISKVPDGDWFCPTCVSKESGQSPHSTKKRNTTALGAKKGSELKLNGKSSVVGELVKEEASSSSMSKKGTRELKKRNSEDNPSSSSQANHDGVVSGAKKAKTAIDDATGLAKCSELLAELEAHQDAWPFLTPVNHKAVPGYKKVIKRPMDFSTIREKLQNNQYSSLDPFIVDMNLVFDNCEKFNEDDSEIGQAGHNMRRFFDKRWTELLM